MTLLSSVREPLELISTELVCPSVLFPSQVRDLQAYMVARRPGCHVLQEIAQGLRGREELVSACLRAGVVASCGQAELPVLSCKTVLGHHCQGELG